MLSSGMLRRVARVRTAVTEEHSASVIRVTRIGVRRLLVTDNVIPSSLILVTLMMEAVNSSETPDRTRATQRNIPQGGILHSQRHKNLKSYICSRAIPPELIPFVKCTVVLGFIGFL
jgi:hypothetical protein